MLVSYFHCQCRSRSIVIVTTYEYDNYCRYRYSSLMYECSSPVQQQLSINWTAQHNASCGC